MSRTRNVVIGGVTFTKRKRYGLFAFIFDVFMIFITGGLWLIWIFAREMRNRG